MIDEIDYYLIPSKSSAYQQFLGEEQQFNEYYFFVGIGSWWRHDENCKA
jgi:hypothetical protein